MTRAPIPSSASRSAAASASCRVIPAATSATVLVGRPQHAAATDLELLVRPVQHGRRRAERPQVCDPVHVRQPGDELRRLVRVARVGHDARVDCAQRGLDVLEAHLRGAVLAHDTPACEPLSTKLARLTAAMRIKS